MKNGPPGQMLGENAMLTQSRNWWILLLSTVAVVMVVRIMRGSFDLGSFSLGFFGGAAVMGIRAYLPHRD